MRGSRWLIGLRQIPGRQIPVHRIEVFDIGNLLGAERPPLVRSLRPVDQMPITGAEFFRVLLLAVLLPSSITTARVQSS